MKARTVLALVFMLGSIAASAVPTFAVEPVVVVATEKTELRPGASTGYVAWFVFDRHFSHVNVWAEAIGSDAPFRVNPKGTTAFTGGIEGTTLVYELRLLGVDTIGHVRSRPTSRGRTWCSVARSHTAARSCCSTP